VTEYLADCCDRHVFAQEVAASVVPQVMPGQMWQTSFLEQRSQHSVLEVLVGIKVARIGTEDQASRVPVSVLHLEGVMLCSQGCEPSQERLV